MKITANQFALYKIFGKIHLFFKKQAIPIFISPSLK